MIGLRECTSMLLILCLVCSGCASVVSGRHAEVEVVSNVSGAHVTIHDKQGYEVATTLTPGKVALPRQRGLLTPEGYTATIAAEGHHTERFRIKQKLNPWVIGNIGFGYVSVIGWAVDNATGAVWQPAESQYYQQLTPIAYASSESGQAAASSEENIHLVSGEAFVSDEGQ